MVSRSALLVVLAMLPSSARAADCDLEGRSIEPLGERYPLVVANPTWGSFFAKASVINERFAGETALPDTRLALALPPPLRGELRLRHRARGWWCAELREEDYQGALDQLRIELPLEVEWRIERAGKVLLRGTMQSQSEVFTTDEIVLEGTAGQVERFPVAPTVWAAPLPSAIERDDAALPSFVAYAELLGKLGVGLEALAAAPAPWPRIALNLAVHQLRQDETTLDEKQRARFLALLQAVAKRDGSAEVSAAVARWTRRLTMFDDTLGPETMEQTVDASTRVLRINGRTVFTRTQGTKASSVVRVPLPRSGLAFIELARDEYYANGGITALDWTRQWQPLTRERSPWTVEKGVIPAARLRPLCLGVDWSGPGEKPSGWLQLALGRRSGPSPLGTWQRASGPSAGASVETKTVSSLVPEYESLSGGTATFTFDEHGAVKGAWSPEERCETR